MGILPRNVLCYGEEQPLAERIPLRAGPLSVDFEEGRLRYVKLGRQEVLRQVYVAIRDHNWNTVSPCLSDLTIDSHDNGFHIEYSSAHVQGGIDFYWRGTITGDASGTICFKMDGVARSTFLRNRIGFCVLHPIRECAGEPCVVEHEDGQLSSAFFPYYISPHQPAGEIRAISHEVIPGLRAEVRFEGDIFEMEDQRNWTDASYKTYCTPLRLPYPVEVKKGTRISQSVTLHLKGDLPKDVPQRKTASDIEPLTLTLAASPSSQLPRIGLSVASHNQALSEKEIARLRALNLAHLRVDLNLAQPDHLSTLRRAAAEADALGVSIEAALILSDNAAKELKLLDAALNEIKPQISTWLIFHAGGKVTGGEWIKTARSYLSAYAPSARFGAGTNAYFTEINREHPPIEALDLVNYSINPQVHAFDNDSLVETFEALPMIVASARQFAGSLPISVSPVTLKPRFNPYTTGAEIVLPGALPSPVDVRQMSLFGAGWTLGCLKQLAESAVESVTYYETTGWRGVMEGDDGPLNPDLFPSLRGAVFPLYHIFADVGDFAGGGVIPTVSSDAFSLNGLTIGRRNRTRTLIANHQRESVQVVLRNINGRARVSYLDETNVMEAMQHPEAFRSREGEDRPTAGATFELTLRPYAIVRIDVEREDG